MRNISDILKEERLKKGLSLDDVVAATKIKKTSIIAIEDGKVNSLPDSYALGFVKNYAEFLGVSVDRAAALYRREHDTKRIETVPKFRKSLTPGMNFSIKSAKTFLVLGVILIVCAYIIYQFSFVFIGPRLTISSPQENSIVESNVVVVSGKTDPKATVTINKEEVYVDLSGSFKKTLFLSSGNREINITSKNTYGSKTSKRIPIKAE